MYIMQEQSELEKLGEKTRELIRNDIKINSKLYTKLCSPMPRPVINQDKDAILFIGMNPAGNKTDAKRDGDTGGLFLNYYEEFKCLKDKTWFCNGQNNEKSFIYKNYFEPILEFYEDILGENKVSWEWCNYKFNDLIEKIKERRKEINADEEKVLRKCYEKYSNSNVKYQIIIRDLVYYHQTKDFKEILISPQNIRVIKEIIVNEFNYYINLFKKGKLKLIHVSSATACQYVKAALVDENHKISDIGSIEYEGIPVIFAGRAFSGRGVIDEFSRIRLKSVIKNILSKR